MNPNFAYHDANGRPLIGPCDVEGCPYQSPPGGGLCAEHARPCPNHDPNSGPGSDQCMSCGRYAIITESEARVLDGNR